MYELSIKTHFSAAHHLRGYPGLCADFHGHNWDVEVFVRGTRLNEMGILLDFKVLKDTVKKALKPVDHADLNALKEFKGKNPTSENIARYLYKTLATELNCRRYRVHRVTVKETPESQASYWEGAR